MTRLLLCALLAGCGPAIDIDTGALYGSLGDVEGFDAPSDEPYSYGDAFNTSVTLQATDAEGRWALARLRIDNSFVEWEPGVYDGAGSVLGCSTVPGELMYDRWADRVEIRIEEGDGPGERRVIYTGTWEDETPRELTGTFDYVLLE